jgi:hypothetical protein
MIHHMCETWSQHTWWLCSRAGLGAPKSGCDTWAVIGFVWNLWIQFLPWCKLFLAWERNTKFEQHSWPQWQRIFSWQPCCTIRWYGCIVAHQKLFWAWVTIVHGQLGWLVWRWPWHSLQLCSWRRSVIKINDVMMKTIIPHIVVAGALLMKVSLLWSMPLLIILCDMSHFLDCFVNLLLQLSQPKHLLPSLFYMLMYSFQVADLLI